MSDGTKIALLSLAGGLLLAVFLLALSVHLTQQTVCAQPAVCVLGPGEKECRTIPETCGGGLSTQAVIALSAGASLAAAVAAALTRRR